MKLTLGQKIRDLRIRKGLTQSELSEGLVTPSMISQIESDKANPSHQLLAQIAEKLDTPIEYFLTDVETQLEKVSAYKLAYAILQKGDYQEALQLFSRMEEAPSTQITLSDIQFHLACCYRKLGEYEKAGELFEACLDDAIAGKNAQKMIAIMNQLGAVAYEQKNYPIAIHYLKKGYDLARKEAVQDPLLTGEIAYRLGMIHSQMSEWELAKQFFEEAAAFMQNECMIRKIADVYLELAKTHRDNGNFDQAAQYAESASALYQTLNLLETVIDAKARFGVSLGETGAIQKGIAELERCMAFYENYGLGDRTGSVHAALASVLFQNGDFEKAIHHCEKALELQSQDQLEKASIYRMLAAIHLENGKYEQALEMIAKAAEIVEQAGTASDKVKVYAVYGDIYKKQGLYREAMECLEKMNAAMVENLRDHNMLL